jgi:hypothetical protein
VVERRVSLSLAQSAPTHVAMQWLAAAVHNAVYIPPRCSGRRLVPVEPPGTGTLEGQKTLLTTMVSAPSRLEPGWPPAPMSLRYDAQSEEWTHSHVTTTLRLQLPRKAGPSNPHISTFELQVAFHPLGISSIARGACSQPLPRRHKNCILDAAGAKRL